MRTTKSGAIEAFNIRPEYPDFLDLPWELNLDQWKEHCPYYVELDRGVSRHTVVFVKYDKRVYAIKELPTDSLAEKEYENLRALKDKELPSVLPVGHLLLKRPNEVEKVSILITVYLEYSKPYRSLFLQAGSERYHTRLLNAMSCLLVRLHLGGFYWGDCSLSNVLFKRDAGELGAFVVDVETSESHDSLSDGQREQDIEIMCENVFGDLSDLIAEYHFNLALPPDKTVEAIKNGYEDLWDEINREVTLKRNERYKIHERIKALNRLGFSVDEIEFHETGEQGILKMKTLVTDQSYHRHVLHNLTGVVAKDNESRVMVNEIKAIQAMRSRDLDRSFSLSVAAFEWLNERYYPTIKKLKEIPNYQDIVEMSEVYCQVLEHKWYLSEQAGHDVGIDISLADFLEKIVPKETRETF